MTARTDVQEFFRSVTVDSPEWASRAEALVRKGDKPMIRLLLGYIQVLPPDLRAAVLAARARL